MTIILPNVTIQNEGTISLFALDEAASAWIEEHVLGEKQWFGARLVVEHRYVHELIGGLRDAGLVVEGAV